MSYPLFKLSTFGSEHSHYQTKYHNNIISLFESEVFALNMGNETSEELRAYVHMMVSNDLGETWVRYYPSFDSISDYEKRVLQAIQEKQEDLILSIKPKGIDNTLPAILSHLTNSLTYKTGNQVPYWSHLWEHGNTDNYAPLMRKIYVSAHGEIPTNDRYIAEWLFDIFGAISEHLLEAYHEARGTDTPLSWEEICSDVADGSAIDADFEDHTLLIWLKEQYAYRVSFANDAMATTHYTDLISLLQDVQRQEKLTVLAAIKGEIQAYCESNNVETTVTI